jgi:hypothetical protein
MGKTGTTVRFKRTSNIYVNGVKQMVDHYTTDEHKKIEDD